MKKKEYTQEQIVQKEQEECSFQEDQEMPGPPKKDIMEQALSHLTFRSRSVAEMRQHLLKKGYEGQQVQDCLERLQDLHYLDDLAYAVMGLRYGLEKKRGLLRIARDLEAKGISRDLFQEAVYQLEEEDSMDVEALQEEQAHYVAFHLVEGQPVTPKLLAKVGRKLANQGYPTSLIYRLLGQLQHERNDYEE